MADGPRPGARLGRLQRAAVVAQGERLLELAAARGWLTEAQVEALADAGDEAIDAAMARGWLTRATVDLLEGELAREDFARGIADAAAPLPAEAAAAEADPARRLGDLVLVAPLGAGGAAEVWKAWDRSIGRWVAVKRPRAALDAREDLDRIQREALAVGRLSHPNIVPLHRVGQHEGRPYLVMPFVDGRTLADLALPLPRALELVRLAALAVEHAHASGLVHRDVKPTNLMLDDGGRLWLLDFGLAHLADQTALGETRPGVALGTAAYMSPEQAAGDPRCRERATDVYGLGATLYHLATGAPPYEGRSFADVVAQVLAGEPIAPRRRRPGLPRDVETIVVTAMARDPARRYASAAAMAEDLRRVLAGEPIAARRSPLRRLAARVRRQRTVWLGGAAAALVVAAVAAVAVQRVNAGRREAIDSVRTMARLSFDSALQLRRAGSPRAMHELLPRLQAAYEAALARAPRLAEADFLMGRMYRALMDDERALAHQERALAADPGFAPARYERLVLLSRRHGRMLARTAWAGRAWGREIGAPASLELLRRPEAERRALASRAPQLFALRDAILADARVLRPASVGEARALTAEGIAAYHRGDLERARAALSRALEKDALAEEVWEVLALTEEAEGRVRAAEAVYSRAIALDRGYVPFLVGRCRVRIELDRARAIDDATAALALDPGMAAALVCRGVARQHAGHQTMLDGRDPLPSFAAADDDFSRALARDGSLWGALWGRGTVRRYRAHHALRTGRDPLPDLAASEADFSRVLAAAPTDPGLRVARGRTRSLRALARMRAGTDPTADLAAAEEDLASALRDESGNRAAWEWLGELRAYRAFYRWTRGEDAEADFRAAEEACERAVSGTMPWARRTRALVRVWRGRAAGRAGGDPLPHWAAAEDDLDRAVAAGPQTADFWWTRGALRLERALAAPQSRARDLAGAAVDLDRALALNPSSVEALLARAAVREATGDRRGAAAARARVAALAPARARGNGLLAP